MASSKVMANEDLPRQSSILPLSLSELQTDQSKNFGSMNIDELLKNIYGDTDAIPDDDGGGGAGGGSAGIGGDVSLLKNAGSKTVDEVWKEIVAGSRVNREPPELTLEDFLAKAGAVREEDVMFPPPPPPPPEGFGVDSMMNSAQFQSPPLIKSQQDGPGVFGVESVGFGDRIDGGVVAVGTSAGVGVAGAGRGKRRMVEQQPVDKATQQKQRRMIKNRESAARSRERKQAYTIELESLVTQLEEENATLLREEAERTKERLELLMVNLTPVVEKRRPPRVLRRTNSM